MEHIFTATYPVTSLNTDCFGLCRPSHLLRFSQDAAEGHCHLLGTDRAAMDTKHYFWAIIRQRMEITRLPKLGETITLKTWPMPTTRVAYPRAAEGFDEKGNLLFKIISIWIIMDKDSRAMVLPGKSGVVVDGAQFGTELKAPLGLSAGTFDHHFSRQVSFYDLDQNGHMNNTRYLDWIFDLYPAAFHREHPLKAVTICYNSEALEEQTMDLSWSEGETLRLDGCVKAEEPFGPHTRIFSAQLEF